METWKLIGAFGAAFIAFNVWTRIKWMMGYIPKTLNQEQGNIAAKEAAKEFVEHIANGHAEEGQPMPPERLKDMEADMYKFGLYVILLYFKRLELPVLDTKPDPIGGSAWEPKQASHL